MLKCETISVVGSDILQNRGYLQNWVSGASVAAVLSEQYNLFAGPQGFRFPYSRGESEKPSRVM